LQLFWNEHVDFAKALLGLIHQHHRCDVTHPFDKKASNMTTFDLVTG